MAELLSTLIPILGRALLHFVWQGALLGLLAAAALHSLRDARPQARYALACGAMLACLLLPSITVLLQLSSPATASAVIGLAEASQPAARTVIQKVAGPSWPGAIEHVFPIIVALWAAGTSVLSLRMAMGLVWIRRLQASPQGLAQALWQARLDTLAGGFALRRQVALRLVDGIATPACAGWWRPVVLLPTALATRMPVDFIEALLAHELAHVRRHDYLVNLLQGVVEALLFYHPVTWWLSRRIRSERELVADRLAVEVGCAPRLLAHALSELSYYARQGPSPPHLAPAAHGGHLMSRIRQLLQPDRRTVSAGITLPLLGIAVACMALIAQAQGTAAKPATDAPRVPTTVRAPTRATGPVPSPASQTPQATRLHDNDAREGFALVRRGQEGFSMSGSSDDIEAIKTARRALDSDFLWFRRASKAYVIVDPATVAKASAAWGEVDKLEPRMRALSEEMEGHGGRLEALGTKMEALAALHEATPAMDAAARRMEQLGEQQEQLGARQSRLAAELPGASAARRAVLQGDMEALSLEMDALAQRMDAQSRILDAESRQLDTNRKPMDALAREMDEASKPMQVLGRQMEALSRQQEQNVLQAERALQALASAAIAQGLARPAPDSSSNQ